MERRARAGRVVAALGNSRPLTHTQKKRPLSAFSLSTAPRQMPPRYDPAQVRTRTPFAASRRDRREACRVRGARCVRRLTPRFSHAARNSASLSLFPSPHTPHTQARRARPPATFDDLPDDVLPHYLALLPTRDRFRAALACRALARAVRPPSTVWADITLPAARLFDPASVARLLPSLRLAGHFLKRLNLFGFQGDSIPTIATLRSVLEVALPHLEVLSLLRPVNSELCTNFVRSAHDALASASRLTRLSIGRSNVFAPCRLPGRAWAAAATYEFVFGLTEQRLRQAAVIAAAAAPAARLAKPTLHTSPFPDHDGALDAFAAVAGAGLTHLSINAGPDQLPALAALVARLPALVELAVRSTQRDDLDLTALASPCLKRVAIHSNGLNGVRVTAATAARLGELVLTNLLSPDPPFRGGGGSGRFTRLTRLEYGPSSACVDLGPWSAAQFFIPTLVELSVIGWAFTLGGRDGRAWAEAVARETLPRLARLELLLPESYSYSWKHEISTYACRAGQKDWRDVRPGCLTCSAPGVCAGGREVERALWEALPAAAADAGRQLVVSDGRRTAEWWSRTDHDFTLHFEAAPPEG
jgi:hypothetical protein